MNGDKVREWIRTIGQTLGIIAIPIVVAIMGNRVAESNATRETNAVYVKTAVDILGAPLTDANRAMRPWATQMLVHFSPVPFTDTAQAVLASYVLDLRPIPLPPSRPVRIVLSPTTVTMRSGDSLNFTAIGLISYGDTALIPDLTWTASGGRITPKGNDRWRHYATFAAGTATGDFVVVARSASARLADSARVHVQPR